MKISKRTVDDLITLIEHVHQDISFNGGGTFCKHDLDNSHDPVDARKAERAITFIKKLILDRDL